MKTFTLHLQSATQYECLEGVTTFAGEDSSGSFGLLAGHERFITVLEFGLARFHTLNDSGNEQEQFLAQPGGVLYGTGDKLVFSTRRYLRDSDSSRLRRALDEELRAEEEALMAVKQSLCQLEETMLRRLWQLQKTGAAYDWLS